MYHGIINVYKEAGYTSHDVVAKLRGILKQKKIGHTGTLDPAAVGVLPVCLGSGTRLCDMLTDKSKEYVAILRLGITTDTQDTTGSVLAEKVVRTTVEEVTRTIESFVGEYHQIPPMYSALKVNGKKLYELARAGKEVEREARQVHIEAIEILSMNLPEVEIRVACSKGTYIRTLCHDIGTALGCGGAMASLKRTRSGDFTIDSAYTLTQLQQLADQNKIAEIVLKVDKVFEHLPMIVVQESSHKLLANGNRISDSQITERPALTSDAEVRVYSFLGKFYGIYRYDPREKCFWPVKMFITEG